MHFGLGLVSCNNAVDKTHFASSSCDAVETGGTTMECHEGQFLKKSARNYASVLKLAVEWCGVMYGCENEATTPQKKKKKKKKNINKQHLETNLTTTLASHKIILFLPSPNLQPSTIGLSEPTT